MWFHSEKHQFKLVGVAFHVKMKFFPILVASATLKSFGSDDRLQLYKHLVHYFFSNVKLN
jgi:hypothetical protein